MNLPPSRTYAGWLAILRILTGFIWLIHGVPKFLRSDEFMPPNGFIVNYITTGVARTTGPYHDFLVNVVQPNIGVFAELVRLGEVCVGISLVLGLLSRLGGLVGMILTLDYMAARGGLDTFNAWSSVDACMMLLSAVNVVLPTGRFLGVGALFGRRPARRAIVPEVVPERPLDRPTAPPGP
ncbi:MAG: DoxX family membrane protein [Candidatus Eremiobacteraeota bacterium]|nr:DoxX family membrane protein [Candidatus Eremiobacteraeota bacterium]